ncbi:MAG: YdcF family protein [Firmicutes bacterium]|nr:YdcF family protein [Bacillota bacterium]
MNKIIKKILKIIGIIIAISAIIILGISIYVKCSVNKKIVDVNNINGNYDAILVFGAGLRNGKPSPVLKDRLDTAYELYEDGYSKKIIVSGDHGKKYYDEVNVMKNYLLDKGVESNDIFMDHAGFSTYDSVYRAKEIFLTNNIIIVTQQFHLYRSLYIANKLGLDAIGVSSTLRNYSGSVKFELREILARDKDFVKVMFKPEPTYLGDTIPVFGDGNVTND